MGCVSSSGGSTGADEPGRKRASSAHADSAEKRKSIVQNATNLKRVPHRMLKRGENINDFYEIGDVLGEGMTGAVKKALDRQTQEYVAVKFVRKAVVKDFKALKKEVELLKQLDHPNVVRLRATYEDRKHFFMILDLCSGGALLDKLLSTPERRFPEAQVAKILLSMCRAIEYCHNSGICHRDLKMDNWLFDSDDGEIVLIDFGLSRKYYNQHHGVTGMLTFLGTPGFVAPEMQEVHQKKVRSYTEAVDMWSLGVIAYALVSGRMPFKRVHNGCVRLEDKMRRAYRQNFSSAVWQTISEDCKHFIDRTLDPIPTTRMTSTESLDSAWLQRAMTEEWGEKKEKALVRHHSSMSKEDVDNIISFCERSSKEKAAMVLVALSLRHDEMLELRSKFNDVDTAHTGLVSLAELEVIMKEHEQIPDRKVEELFHYRQADDHSHSKTKQDACIPYTEFLAACMDKHLLDSKDRLKQAFEKFKKMDDGRVDLSEFVQIFEGDNFEDHRHFSKAINEHMTARSSRVNFDEFVELLDEHHDSSIDRIASASRLSRMGESSEKVDPKDIQLKD
eukprot:g2915.t1